jgi:hypothetical protein
MSVETLDSTRAVDMTDREYVEQQAAMVPRDILLCWKVAAGGMLLRMATHDTGGLVAGEGLSAETFYTCGAIFLGAAYVTRDRLKARHATSRCNDTEAGATPAVVSAELAAPQPDLA